jgi:hypothetical protein
MPSASALQLWLEEQDEKALNFENISAIKKAQEVEGKPSIDFNDMLAKFNNEAEADNVPKGCKLVFKS